MSKQFFQQLPLERRKEVADASAAFIHDISREVLTKYHARLDRDYPVGSAQREAVDHARALDLAVECLHDYSRRLEAAVEQRSITTN